MVDLDDEWHITTYIQLIVVAMFAPWAQISVLSTQKGESVFTTPLGGGVIQQRVRHEGRNTVDFQHETPSPTATANSNDFTLVSSPMSLFGRTNCDSQQTASKHCTAEVAEAPPKLDDTLHTIFTQLNSWIYIYRCICFFFPPIIG